MRCKRDAKHLPRCCNLRIVEYPSRWYACGEGRPEAKKLAARRGRSAGSPALVAAQKSPCAS